MIKSDVELIKLIQENKSINEICDILNCNRNKIYKKLLNLKNSGYTINQNYFYNGDIKYKLVKGRNFIDKNNVTIKMENTENKFCAMIISDLHIGSDKQRLDLLYQVYNYCAKNSINIILNTGDIVDGWIGTNKKINKDLEHQLNYLLKKYPFDKNILNFICLGNHDVDSYNKYGINLKVLLENYRHDLVAFGARMGTINIKNDNIILCHQTGSEQINLNNIENSIIFEGHHHKFATSYNHSLNNNLIYVPSLSDIYINKQITTPSALIIEFDLEANVFTHGIISQLISNGNSLIKINEIRLSNLHRKQNKNQSNKPNTKKLTK